MSPTNAAFPPAGAPIRRRQHARDHRALALPGSQHPACRQLERDLAARGANCPLAALATRHMWRIEVMKIRVTTIASAACCAAALVLLTSPAGAQDVDDKSMEQRVRHIAVAIGNAYVCTEKEGQKAFKEESTLSVTRLERDQPLDRNQGSRRFLPSVSIGARQPLNLNHRYGKRRWTGNTV